MWQVRGRREEIWLGLGRLVSGKTRERSMAQIAQGLTTYVLSHTDSGLGHVTWFAWANGMVAKA